MGLNDTLLNQGSRYSKYDGQTPGINPLATRQSKLHGTQASVRGGAAGYSIDGAYQKEVSKYYAEYDDGDNLNTLPRPSNYDINGITPIGPLKDPSTISINNTFIKGEYLKNLPK